MQPDPERIDDENPEWTAEDFKNARPAAEVLPELIGQKATDALMRGDSELRAEREEPFDWSGCPLVETDPDIHSGAPVLRGTRMPVDAIVGNFDYGESAASIAEQFQIPLEPVEAVLAYVKDRREWERLLAYGQARFRARLLAEGRDPDRMTEEEKEDYVERAIDEYRQEQRKKEAEP